MDKTEITVYKNTKKKIKDFSKKNNFTMHVNKNISLVKKLYNLNTHL